MWRAVGVNCKWYSHLSCGDGQVFYWEKTGVGIQHFDLSFIGEINFRLISYDGQYISANADACIAYFETTGSHFCLILKLSTDSTVYFRQVIFCFQLFFINLLSVLVAVRSLSVCCQRQ